MPDEAQAQPSPPSGDPEIDRLKERLSFYESFDQLIQTNVSQAGNLLREAIDLREIAAADAESARHRIEAERTDGQERYRALFSVMLDEITALQGQAERLARRLTDAIDQLESELGPGTEFPPLTSSLTAELGFGDQPPDENGHAPADDATLDQQDQPVALGSGSDEVNLTVEEVLQPLELHAGHEPAPVLDDSLAAESDDQPNPLPLDAHEQTPEQPAGLQEPLPAGGAPALDDTLIDIPSEPASERDGEATGQPAEPAQTPSSGRGQFILLVHGVPRAATALSLKRHLEMLETVQSVEPREFAAGVLRLQLQVERAIAADDLKGWTEESGFRTIHARPGLLEIQLLA